MCFPISGRLTASAKLGTGLLRATCARKDGTPPDCEPAFCKRCGMDRSRGKRDLNENENWRKEEREQNWRKEERGQTNQLIRLRLRDATQTRPSLHSLGLHNRL